MFFFSKNPFSWYKGVRREPALDLIGIQLVRTLWRSSSSLAGMPGCLSLSLLSLGESAWEFLKEPVTDMKQLLVIHLDYWFFSAVSSKEALSPTVGLLRNSCCVCLITDLDVKLTLLQPIGAELINNSWGVIVMPMLPPFGHRCIPTIIEMYV